MGEVPNPQPRRKPRATKKRITGTYPIDTGSAAVIPDPDRDGGYILEVNNVPSSYVVPGAPEVLEFEYMRTIAVIVDDAQFPAGFTAVHLGAAGCALPSYFSHHFGNRNIAVEVDAGLARVVRELFDPPVEIRVAEARSFTHALEPGSTDVLIRDVFAGPSTPRPLTTVEFYRAAHRALSSRGLFIANIGDTADLANTRAELAGLATVFRHTAAAGAKPEYGNVIVAASDAPLRGDGLREGRMLIDATRPRHDGTTRG